MGSMSSSHWLIVLAVVLIVFGGGSKISGPMGDFGKGLNAFRKNVGDDEQSGAQAASLSGGEACGSASRTVLMAAPIQGVRYPQPELASQA